MMSLIEVNYLEIVRKQYFHKLKANFRLFGSMAIMQLLGVLFSLGGSGGSGGGNGFLYIDITYYSADNVVFFTLLWGLMVAIHLTTKAYRNEDFTFVTDRITSHLSNILFLLTSCVIGGICAIFSGFLLKDAMYYIFQSNFLKATSFIDLSELSIGVVATCLYILLVTAFGYFVGALVQLNKSFIFIIPAFFVGFTAIKKESYLGFFFTEHSLLFFSIKVILISALLFLVSIATFNRMEVRR